MADRNLSQPVFFLVALVLLLGSAPAYCSDLQKEDDTVCSRIMLAEALIEYYPLGWFYTLAEMEKIYEQEYYENSRLKNFIRLEQGKCMNSCDNEENEIPRRFVETTLSLLQQMLEQDLAKYLFRLDTFHGHLFVTDITFEDTYLHLPAKERMKALVRDQSLAVLFHCAEHLALRNPPHTGAVDNHARQLILQRNIIGWYEDGEIEVYNPAKSELVGSGESNTATIPPGHRPVGALTFKANVNGEFSIEHDNQTIWLDISLCDYFYY